MSKLIDLGCVTEETKEFFPNNAPLDGERDPVTGKLCEVKTNTPIY